MTSDTVNGVRLELISASNCESLLEKIKQQTEIKTHIKL